MSSTIIINFSICWLNHLIFSLEVKKKTSTLRWFLGDVESDSFTKIEDISTDLVDFSNEFWVSFFIGNQIYDKKYVFVKGSICFENLTTLPYFFEKGILIK